MVDKEPFSMVKVLVQRYNTNLETQHVDINWQAHLLINRDERN